MTEPLYADVILPRHLRRTFTYRIPESLRPRVQVGTHVVVPFGQGRLDGLVIAVGRTAGAGLKLKDIDAISEQPGAIDVPPDLLALSRQVADRYLAPWGQCIRLILPPHAPTRKRPPRRRKDTPHDVSAQQSAAPPATRDDADSRPAWWPELLASLNAAESRDFVLIDRAPRQWRIMLQAAEAAVAHGRRVLIVTPTASRADALAGLISDRHAVLLWHSGVPPRDRAAAWSTMRAGAPNIVIGTRSAIFAPLPDIGLIAIDDEDEPALKEETEPRYHAREVARVRARQHGAVLLLASPHPAFETLSRAGLLSQTALPVLAMAPRELIDLRRTAFGSPLSDRLIAAINETLAAGDRVVLFLNRKGFAPALQCRDCGASPSCPRCRVALTFFKRRGRLACHYCGAAYPLPDVCPDCGAAKLEPSGTGTERVEDVVRRLCPAARIERLDRDRAPRPRDAEAIRRRFNDGTIDVLIGTQMLVQGPPLRTVGLVGLVHADAGLHLPDFRAGERTYHALLDAASLARPDGRVLVQTYLPTHPVIEAIARNEPARFYEPELAFREALGYPPFGHLISLRVSGTNHLRVEAAANGWKKRLARAGSEIVVLGPIPAAVPQLRGRYRWQMVVKSPSGAAARAPVRETLEELEAPPRRGLKYEVDVDPVELA